MLNVAPAFAFPSALSEKYPCRNRKVFKTGYTSVLYHWYLVHIPRLLRSGRCNYWIKWYRLYFGISGLEVPLYFSCILIVLHFPCGQFSFKSVNCIYTAWQTLACHYIKFNFLHIKPTSMFGSVVNFQTLYDPPCFSRRKGFVQRCCFMGIKDRKSVV